MKAPAILLVAFIAIAAIAGCLGATPVPSTPTPDIETTAAARLQATRAAIPTPTLPPTATPTPNLMTAPIPTATPTAISPTPTLMPSPTPALTATPGGIITPTPRLPRPTVSPTPLTLGWSRYNSPRNLYSIDTPSGWRVNDSNTSAVLILGPGSALFTIGLTNPPGISLDQLVQDFINGGFFRRVEPRYFHISQLTIAGIPGRRMTYSYHLGGGCIINLNQVFLITERSLVLLTGTTCIGEEALFPSAWIERMQASFTPISPAPTPTPTANHTTAPRRTLGSARTAASAPPLAAPKTGYLRRSRLIPSSATNSVSALVEPGQLSSTPR